FLPSTGRLVKYRPPTPTMEAAQPVPAEGGVRVDTGVYEGGEIPMYYDSMIAKLIVHGRDRHEAIAKMREALNGFVIRGISSNIPFQAALLAHPKFVTGQFNTGFIAEHYAKGFRAEDVPHDDPSFLIAIAGFVRCKARHRAAGISGQVLGHEVAHVSDFVVVVLGEQGHHEYHQVQVGEFDPISGKAEVRVDGRTFAIQSRTKLGDILMVGTVNGQPFSAQVERGAPRQPLALRIAHNGTAIAALVLSPRAAAMFKLMPYKAPPDLSKMLLSPMPGLLVNVAVQPGQKVLAGERLAVIEAMKMENILTATQDCVVKAVKASVGESLAVDQTIIEFE
ncbi:MAG: biotin/lipoyl-containing protein, partial [Betaproteobacteria bacterium]